MVLKTHESQLFLVVCISVTILKVPDGMVNLRKTEKFLEFIEMLSTKLTNLCGLNIKMLCVARMPCIYIIH